MTGPRSTKAPALQYFAESSGPPSSATSGAVLLLIARWMSVGPFPPTLSTVIQGYAWWTPSSTPSRIFFSRPVKKLHTVTVTGACDALGFELTAVGVVEAPPAVHAVARMAMVAMAARNTCRRFIPLPPSLPVHPAGRTPGRGPLPGPWRRRRAGRPPRPVRTRPREAGTVRASAARVRSWAATGLHSARPLPPG